MSESMNSGFRAGARALLGVCVCVCGCAVPVWGAFAWKRFCLDGS